MAEALSRAGLEVLSRQENRVVFTSRGEEDLRTFWRLVYELDLEVRHLGREVVTLEDAVVRMMGQGNTEVRR